MNHNIVQLPISGLGYNQLYVGTDNGAQDQAFNGWIDDAHFRSHLSSNDVAALYSFESTSPDNIVII